eukprot:10405114-Lingulodinium_polyedra.AAC.1
MRERWLCAIHRSGGVPNSNGGGQRLTAVRWVGAALQLQGPPRYHVHVLCRRRLWSWPLCARCVAVAAHCS